LNQCDKGAGCPFLHEDCAFDLDCTNDACARRHPHRLAEEQAAEAARLALADQAELYAHGPLSGFDELDDLDEGSVLPTLGAGMGSHDLDGDADGYGAEYYTSDREYLSAQDHSAHAGHVYAHHTSVQVPPSSAAANDRDIEASNSAVQQPMLPTPPQGQSLQYQYPHQQAPPASQPHVAYGHVFDVTTTSFSGTSVPSVIIPHHSNMTSTASRCVAREFTRHVCTHVHRVVVLCHHFFSFCDDQW